MFYCRPIKCIADDVLKIGISQEDLEGFKKEPIEMFKVREFSSARI
jgi:hypothetical protein